MMEIRRRSACTAQALDHRRDRFGRSEGPASGPWEGPVSGAGEQGWQGHKGSPTRDPRLANPGKISDPRPATPSDPSRPGRPEQLSNLSLSLSFRPPSPLRPSFFLSPFLGPLLRFCLYLRLLFFSLTPSLTHTLPLSPKWGKIVKMKIFNMI